MTKINVGVQAMMLKGKFDELGAYDTLKKVHELGYGSVEISQIPMNAANVDAMRRAQDDFGIKIAAVSAGVAPNGPMPQETIATHFDKIVADCKALDCNFVRIGMLPFGCMASLDEVLHFCRMANVAAQKLADQGIKLYYHNHHIEFQRFEGKLLLDGTPAEVFSQGALIKSVNLDVPPIVELADELRALGISVPDEIITEEEMVAYVCQYE